MVIILGAKNGVDGHHGETASSYPKGIAVHVGPGPVLPQTMWTPKPPGAAFGLTITGGLGQA